MAETAKFQLPFNGFTISTLSGNRRYSHATVTTHDADEIAALRGSASVVELPLTEAVKKADAPKGDDGDDPATADGDDRAADETPADPKPKNGKGGKRSKKK